MAIHEIKNRARTRMAHDLINVIDPKSRPEQKNQAKSEVKEKKQVEKLLNRK